MRSARCPERGTPGAGNGPEKRAGRKTGTALRADFTSNSRPELADLPYIGQLLILGG